MTSNNQQTVGALYLLPFFIFFTVCGVSFIHPDYGSQVLQDNNIFNQIILSAAYFLAFKLALKQPGFISGILKKALPLNILLFLLLISFFWSDFPGKIIISFIHNIGSVFIALCMAVLLLQDKDKFFKILLLTLFTYILATITITLLRPDIGVMTSSNIYDVSVIGRWRGLTTHPNSLGAICIFTAWVALCNLFYTNNKKWISWLAIITLIADFYCLYKANSMTSLLLSTALVFGILWVSFIENATGGVKAIKIMLGLFALFTGLMLLYILHPELLSEKHFFSAIGRNASLSGRSSLWEIGFQGFAAKPFFGWSYDSLRTFLKQYHLGYGQLHNGYLDLLVRGGLVSIFFFTLLLLQLFGSLIRQALRNNKDYIFILGLILVILMHNMTETSILTNTNNTWLIFLMGYFYCLGIDRFQSLSTNVD